MKALSYQVVSCCAYDKLKNMLHMHGILLYMIDYWADPVVHFLLLKSFIAQQIVLKSGNKKDFGGFVPRDAKKA